MRRFAMPIVLLGLFSCEKEVHIHSTNTVSQLVIEGKIEQGAYPVVVLSHSLGYFSGLDSTQTKNNYVHGATITVTDNGYNYDLREYSRDTVGGSIYYYTADSSRQPNRGIPGHNYGLKIVAEGKTYISSTTIPSSHMTLDSIWYKRVLYDGDSNYAELRVRISDPPEKGNFVRYFTKRNREPFYPGLFSTENDDLVNGAPSNITLDRGINRNEKIDYQTYAYFRLKDTVTVKFCGIDRATYNFWRTLDFSFNNNGNPFSSPIVIVGNIPETQGYWGGYSVQYATIIMTD
ncbi:protein of unknown function [Chitinophaga costaii]|uniref:DUF4249 domain-containing protein n=1 Tax=Chitinophaga costaii TaxID=1335309 RepID=A0A1C4E6M8_9BACT|nr:DUF4249 domain-containing protein [Chitinophaga costaii]PUZ24293.1 DUF4249 domain-containing protein [Chitinophaga costaii]SCC39171.1 protein of unknown function [Chitinophaga costaii]